jgi:4-amino-4-deoxy-L-arabinose transferase-like glycosyltransferase
MMQFTMNRGDTGRRRIWLTLVLPLAAGLLLRLWYIHKAARVDGDSLLYGDLARNLLQHGVYGFTRIVNGLPAAPRLTLIRLPGYPLFLALCFRLFGIANYSAVLLVQVAVDLCTCLLLAALARRLFGPRAGLAALWLACLCPFTSAYAAAPLTETLTLFCIALAFYAFERWREAGADIDRWLFAIAAALAYAILLRPEQGMLAAAVVPAMFFAAARGKGLAGAIRTGLVVSVLALLPLVPWTIRNERAFHVFEPLAPRFATDPGEQINYGFQRWYRTWAIDFASTQQVYWNYNGDRILLRDLPSRAFDSQAQFDQTAALLGEYNLTSTATPALDRRFDALACVRIHAHPLRYCVVLPVARLLNMMLRPRIDTMAAPLIWWNFHAWPRETLFAASYAAVNLAYLVAGALGFLRWRRLGLPPIAWAMAATILLRCALLLTIDNSEPRYTLEFFPILIVFAAVLWKLEASF